MVPTMVMVPVSMSEADVDERRRTEARRNNHGCRNTDGLCINDSPRRRRVIVNGSRLGDDDRRGSRHIDDWRWSGNVNGSGVQGVAKNMNGGDSGEDFADRGPFTVSGGGRLNTGSNKSGEA